jgi:putative sigma-54 modulation protein
VVVKQKDKDLHAAIDIATDRVAKILRRHADKIKAHDAIKLSDVAILEEEDSIAKELEKLDEEIIPIKLESYKPTEIEEALNNLKDSEQIFKVFYDMDDNLRVLYKMKDGIHFGLY